MGSCARCAELQAAYDDFQAQSRELEEGLEQELQAAQKQVETTKAKLDKANAALAAERDAHKTSTLQLHAHVATLQSELQKSTSLVESLKASRRTTETSATDADERVRRLEAVASDAAERVDSLTEQAVMAKLELEEHQQMHAEHEARHKQAMKEMEEELHRLQRQLEAGGGGATSADGTTASSDEVAQLREELSLLQEEKAALNSDIEEVTTDLTRVQDENEALTAQMEELQAKIEAAEAKAAGDSAAGEAVPAAAMTHTSLPADLERIDSLTAELAAAQAALSDSQAAASEEADQRLAQAQAEYTVQLAAKQQELDAALAAASQAQAQAAAEIDAATKSHSDRLAAVQASLAAESARVADLQAQLTTQETALRSQIAELTTARAADQKAAESARVQAASSLAEQTSLAKQAASTAALLKGELAEARSLASAGNADEKESMSQQRIADLNQQLQALQAQLDARESELARQATEVAETIRRLTEAQEALNSLQSTSAAEAARLRDEADKLRTEVQAARDETAAARAAADKARDEAAAQISAVRSELDAAPSTSGAEVDQLRATLRARESELADLTATYDTQSALVAAQASQLRTLQSQLTVAQDLHAAFETSFQDSESKRAALQTQLADTNTTATATASKGENGITRSPPKRPSSTSSSGDAGELAALRKERVVLQAQLAAAQTQQQQQQQQDDGLLEVESGFNFTSPPALNGGVTGFAALTERERVDGTQVGVLSKSIRHTLDDLISETSRQDVPSEVSQALQPLVSTLQSDLDQSLTLLSSMQQNLSDSTDRELELMGKLSTLKGSNIRVFCRVRPMLPHELSEAREENLLAFPSEQQISIRTDVARRNRTKLSDTPSHRGHTNSLPDAADGEHSSDYSSPQALASYTPFAFDKVFQPQATQEEVFESVQEMILPVLNGYRACIFAFGQTGSGKTYTMEGGGSGDLHDVGITYRALQTLFRGITNRGSSYKYEVRLTVLELYNENWSDLLEGATVGHLATDDQTDGGMEEADADNAQDDTNAQDSAEAASSSSSKKKLFVRKGHNGHYVEGASRRVVSTVQEVLELLSHAYKQRHIESTAMNEASSRSHLILQVEVIGINIATQVTSYGHLSLVDLAGSERVSRSGVTGARLVEAAAINKSLSALSGVFSALTDSKSKHVPFRDSKLTRLLESSFTGNSKTLMFVNVSPAAVHAGETLCSLQFAVRARQVRLEAGQAALDGWGHKYKSLMAAQQAAFATREKNYAQQFKNLKGQLKTCQGKLEATQAELKAALEKQAETQRALDRSESDRLKALTSALPGSSTKDRRLELVEDRKFDRLQQDLTAAQTRAAEAKANAERVQNEWKDKYAALEATLKETTEKLRVARLEVKGIKPASTFGGGGEASAAGGASGGDAAAPSAEDAARELEQMTRKINLLELEVKRLKLVNRAVTQGSLRSPTKGHGGSRGGGSNSLTGPLHMLSVATADEDNTNGAIEGTGGDDSNGSTPLPSSAAPTPTSRLGSLAPPSLALGLAAPSPSGLRAPTQIASRSGSASAALASGPGASALTAAKQAALLAQKRAQAAQAGKTDTAAASSEGDAAGGEGSAPSTYQVGSIMAKRRSLLPPPSKPSAALSAASAAGAAAIAASSVSHHARTSSSSSSSSLTGQAGLLDDLLEESSQRSEDGAGSEAGDSAAASAAASSVPATGIPRRNSAIRKPRLPTAATGGAPVRTSSIGLKSTTGVTGTGRAASSSVTSAASRPAVPKLSRSSLAAPVAGLKSATSGAAAASSANSTSVSPSASPAAPPVRSMLRPPTTLVLTAPAKK